MERFWKHVEKTNACWNWMASGRGQGYGCFKYQNKTYDTHRFVWYLIHGSFSEKWVLHKCNNRKCVNPDHLYEGSAKENYADMRASGNEYERNKKYTDAKERKRAGLKRWYEKNEK